MDCTACGSPTLVCAVPEGAREHLRAEPAAVALCTHCLHVEPVEDPPAEPPDLRTVSDAVPPDPEGALAALLAIGLLENLALNRAAVRALLERAEREGVDVLLLLDRLAGETDRELAFDPQRRRQQVLEFLGD